MALDAPRHARFVPKRLDTLRPGLALLTGIEITVVPAWEIDEGEYRGQTAYIETRHPGFLQGYWVPSEDLEWL